MQGVIIGSIDNERRLLVCGGKGRTAELAASCGCFYMQRSGAALQLGKAPYIDRPRAGGCTGAKPGFIAQVAGVSRQPWEERGDGHRLALVYREESGHWEGLELHPEPPGFG